MKHVVKMELLKLVDVEVETDGDDLDVITDSAEAIVRERYRDDIDLYRPIEVDDHEQIIAEYTPM